jgi:hypothetical protein
MIRVHEKQLGEVGRTLALEQFEDEMVVHLHGFSPRHAGAMGDDWIRRAIRLGIERAGVYGVTNPGLLRFYVELMFLFGGMFDTDPLHLWAGEILRDATITAEAVRIDHLYDATQRYLDATGGVGPKVALPILRHIKRVLSESLSATDPLFDQKLLDALASMQPERCAYLGEPPLRELLQRARESAAQHGVATDVGIVVFTVLMFAIGHGFTEDPTFPRIGDRLRSSSIEDPAQRALHLRKRTLIYVSRAIHHFESHDDVP